MRVALVQELGGIESVELQERPDPTPRAGQAAVKVGAAGVGPWDVAIISIATDGTANSVAFWSGFAHGVGWNLLNEAHALDAIGGHAP
jgi:NADPH:quinone reductase-like Zn-dependent oxidoreductase